MINHPKVRPAETGTCIIWHGRRSSGGYGRMPNGEPAHRYFYRITRGEIPTGLVLDHLCRNPSCINPDHLEPVTIRENLIRGEFGPVARKVRQTDCIHGHPLEGRNLYITPTGQRKCRTCRAARVREYLARKRKR
jgi:hypothetical protein